ncbi:hypothetical protein B0H66DRAFT_150527 [Apodospora peruviana]|uniref:Uncharacterized protein n=1 Tax=Apodospora peruviana TaxID=516989 RepID=A0AAE0IJT1_9PEZI|nr:hypothetical protein B0H66DRAFT_150527 [Apodospora peruviana]
MAANSNTDFPTRTGSSVSFLLSPNPRKQNSDADERHRPHGRPDTVNRTDRAREYAGYVAQLANRGQGSHLYCGSHFRALNSVLLNRRAPSANEPDVEEFSYVVVRDVGPRSQTLVYKSSAGGAEAFAGLPDADGRKTTRLVFVRGYPSPDWICRLGSHYRLDVEFFRQKLHFLEDKSLYDLPQVPSNHHNMFRLRVPVVYQRQRALKLAEVRHLRQVERKMVSRHHHSLVAVGDSIIRQLSVIDETHFILDQEVSIYMARKGGRTQTAIVWLDTGRDLSTTIYDLWSSLGGTSSHTEHNCLPTIRHIPDKILLAASQDSTEPAPTQTAARPSAPKLPYGLSSLPPSITHLPHQYGVTLQPEMAGVDLTYALSELFFFAASNESQLLNLVGQRIQYLVDQHKGQESLAMDELNYCMRLLQTAVANLQNVSEFLAGTAATTDIQGSTATNGSVDLAGPASPTGFSSPSKAHSTAANPTAGAINHPPRTHEAAAEAASMLTRDFEALLRRAEQLLGQARDGMAFISSRVMLEESRRAMSKADRLARLTLLAFFFLPLSLTASLFGMNFRELEDLSIWVMFVTLVPVTLVAGVICFWDRVKKLKWGTGD